LCDACLDPAFKLFNAFPAFRTFGDEFLCVGHEVRIVDFFAQRLDKWFELGVIEIRFAAGLEEQNRKTSSVISRLVALDS